MATIPVQPAHHHHVVSRSLPAQAIQMIQGCYYVLAGLTAALIPGVLVQIVGPPITVPWTARVIGLAVAGFGGALCWSGSRSGRGAISSAPCMIVALLLTIHSALGVGMNILPLTFLLDAGAEFGFFCWWVVTMLGRTDELVDRTTPLPH